MFRVSFCLVLILSLCSVSYTEKVKKSSKTTCSGTLCPKTFNSKDLIFEENFDKFNLDTWKHENTLSGGGNWEFQWYTNNRSNSFAKDGILHIRPTLTSETIGEENLSKMTLNVASKPYGHECTDSRHSGCERKGTDKHILNPVKSAKITTVNSFTFKYGRVEVRAKLPSGDWLWPAIWLYPAKSVYGGWPASGEIDMMESRGNKEIMVNGKNIGSEHVSSALHWGTDGAHNAYTRTHFTKNSPVGKGFHKKFHKYTLKWTPTYIKFYVDDFILGTVMPNTTFWKFGEFDKTNMKNPWTKGTDMAPFDQEFYFILNLAVGGTNGFFPDKADNDMKKPWKNSSPAAYTDFWKGRADWLPTWKMNEKDGESSSLLIDYVKVWAL